MKRFLTPLLTLVLAVCAVSVHASGSVVLRADGPAGSVLDPGDRVSFRLQTASDAAVVVFDIDTQGYVHLLHPLEAPDVLAARETLEIPADGSELFAGGEPGVEFVFALAVDDPASLDANALEALRDGGAAPRRITGDPFVAANMIAAELVRNVASSGATFGYTWFFISQRVDYPCYLCGECDTDVVADGCEGASIAQNFDRRAVLAYPLRRGYEVSDPAAVATEEPAPSSSVVIPDDGDDVIVNFYPYGSEVRYADPFAVNLWYDWGWYDPFFWSYPWHYPYWYGPGWSVSIGFGWGWGWGGYYCSGWYDPWYGCGYPYYPYDPYYPGYPGQAPEPFKSKYKSGGGEGAASLAGNYKYAAKRDGELRVASKDVRAAPARTATTRSKAGATGVGTAYTGSRVKTSVSGSANRGLVRDQFSRWRNSANVQRYAPGTGRDGQVYRSKPGASTPSGGRSAIQRGGGSSGRSKSGAVAPGGSSRPAPTGRTSSPQMRSGGTRSAPPASSRGGGIYRGGAGGGSKGSSRGGKGR